LQVSCGGLALPPKKIATIAKQEFPQDPKTLDEEAVETLFNTANRRANPMGGDNPVGPDQNIRAQIQYLTDRMTSGNLPQAPDVNGLPVARAIEINELGNTQYPIQHEFMKPDPDTYWMARSNLQDDLQHGDVSQQREASQALKVLPDSPNHYQGIIEYNQKMSPTTEAQELANALGGQYYRTKDGRTTFDIDENFGQTLNAAVGGSVLHRMQGGRGNRPLQVAAAKGYASQINPEYDITLDNAIHPGRYLSHQPIADQVNQIAQQVVPFPGNIIRNVNPGYIDPTAQRSIRIVKPKNPLQRRDGINTSATVDISSLANQDQSAPITKDDNYYAAQYDQSMEDRQNRYGY
jgi:hypothetical protein